MLSGQPEANVRPWRLSGMNFTDFETIEVPTGRTSILLRHAGFGPALLPLHGFSQTHLMW
jgi:hypothetical protein